MRRELSLSPAVGFSIDDAVRARRPRVPERSLPVRAARFLPIVLHRRSSSQCATKRGDLPNIRIRQSLIPRRHARIAHAVMNQ